MNRSRTQTAITNDFKLRIENSIWGTGATSRSSSQLDWFFKYCHHEMGQAGVMPEMRVEQLDAVLTALGILKSDHNKPKRELCSLLSNPLVVDLSVRLMLATGCRAQATIGGDIFRPRWKDHESLVQYIIRVYPQHDGISESAAGRGGQPISLRKLSADYLRAYADINIRWTEHLTDHLLLKKGPRWKNLYLFKHPAFILKSLQTLADAELEDEADEPDPKMDAAEVCADSISRGCLPPALLLETLHTFEILFPPVGDIRSRRLLAKEVALHELDPALLQTLQFQSSDHESPSDVQRATDIHSLYQRFPYWAARLHELWAEADDPEPTSYIGKYTERKKSPRFMYWCGVLGIMVAIMFGIVSTVLGCLQVWISYCSWVNDSSIRGCGLKKATWNGPDGSGG
ncbi:hypothetical protein B0H66DRAFT_643524 [Apodospora peruviana]|uniref:Uncharacterized protein n=1 Tax=Apodospora peruviana TaxID=516989 RepID=A0AAE0HW92_9PEZI|nr:hypothetical protein B0H66DRAFT_643524 [Apodospora peruviana]